MRTDKDRIATAEADLAWCDHPAIRAFARYSTAQSRLSMLDALGAGVEQPDPIRASARRSRPAACRRAHQPAKHPRMPGFREAAVPRNPGWLFAQAITVRSSCTPWHRPVVCWSGIPSSAMRSTAKRTYPDQRRDQRDRIRGCVAAEKRAGVQGAPQSRQGGELRVRRRSQGGEDGRLRARQLRRDHDRRPGARAQRVWLDTFDELRHYFRHIDGLLKDVYWDEEQEQEVRTGSVRHLYTGSDPRRLLLHRAANSYSRGSRATVPKALYEVVRECKIGTGPLAGCIPVLMIHDGSSWGPARDRAEAARSAPTDHGETEMARWIPDYPTTAPPALMSRWYKNAGRSTMRTGGWCRGSPKKSDPIDLIVVGSDPSLANLGSVLWIRSVLP